MAAHGTSRRQAGLAPWRACKPRADGRQLSKRMPKAPPVKAREQHKHLLPDDKRTVLSCLVDVPLCQVKVVGGEMTRSVTDTSSAERSGL